MIENLRLSWTAPSGLGGEVVVSDCPAQSLAKMARRAFELMTLQMTDAAVLPGRRSLGAEHGDPFDAKLYLTPPCTSRREGDELVCPCGLRWDANGERPPCPR